MTQTKADITHVDKHALADAVAAMRGDADRILAEAFALENTTREKLKVMRQQACGIKIQADKLEEMIS